MDSDKTFVSTRHRLLFEAASWSLKGYYQKNNQSLPLKGHLKVEPGDRGCTFSCELFHAVSELKLLERISHLSGSLTQQKTSSWQDEQSPIGPLRGQLSIIEETLLVNLFSQDKIYQSVESFLRVFDGEYETWGVIYQQSKRLGMWRLELVRH